MFDDLPRESGGKILTACPGCRGVRWVRKVFVSQSDVMCFRDSEDRFPVRFSLNKCRSCAMIGKRHRGAGRSRVPGYEMVNHAGHVLVLQASGKFKGKHRIMMEQILGRELLVNELVRFKDGDAKNLIPENLVLCKRKK